MGLGGPHCPASGRACLPGRGQANPHLGQIPNPSSAGRAQRSVQPRDYRPTAVAVCLDLVYRPTPCDKVGSADDTLWTGCTWTLGMASRTARYVDSKGAGTCTRLATSETVWSLRAGPTPATSQGEEERGGESDDGERERGESDERERLTDLAVVFPAGEHLRGDVRRRAHRRLGLRVQQRRLQPKRIAAEKKGVSAAARANDFLLLVHSGEK